MPSWPAMRTRKTSTSRWLCCARVQRTTTTLTDWVRSRRYRVERGRWAQTYTFNSFGKQTASSGSLTNPFQYTARESDAETSLHYYRARYYDTSSGRFLSEDPMAFNAGMNFYAYVNSNPANLADPKGLFGAGDILPAWNHYCDGSGTPWSSPFASINWGNTDADINSKVRAMIGGSCVDKTIPVSVKMGVQTWGADAAIIGRHAVRVQGTIHVSCDCTWSFQGDMSSAQGYDLYDFPPSNRDPLAEGSTWVGRHRCPGKGMPFRIYLPGSLDVSTAGRINGGTPTCPCNH